MPLNYMIVLNTIIVAFVCQKGQNKLYSHFTSRFLLLEFFVTLFLHIHILDNKHFNKFDKFK